MVVLCVIGLSTFHLTHTCLELVVKALYELNVASPARIAEAL